MDSTTTKFHGEKPKFNTIAWKIIRVLPYNYLIARKSLKYARSNDVT